MNLRRLIPLVRPRNYLDWYGQLSHLAQQRGARRLDIVRELLHLRARTGIGLEEYRFYGLCDSAKSWSWKESYMTENASDYDLMCRALNPAEYWSLFNNKLIFNRYFGAIGLPVTTVLGLFDPQFDTTHDSCLLRTEEQFAEFLLQHVSRGVVVKHVEGMRGSGVFVFTELDAGNARPLVNIDGRRFDMTTLLEKMRKTVMRQSGSFSRVWFIEKRMHLHPDIARLCGPTLSCMRMQTFIESDGRAQLIASVIKIPNKVRSADNLHFGGVGIWVDPETGVLGRGRSMNEKDVNWLTSLPWNGIEFYGMRVPFWEEARDVVLRAAAGFPWCRCIGWDVAVTPTGPVLIEGNHNFSLRLVQAVAPQGLLSDGIRTLCEGSRNGSSVSQKV
jgi:hypothetical protein